MVINIHDKVFHILEVVNKKKKSSKKKKKLKHQLKLNLLLLLFEEWGAGYLVSNGGCYYFVEGLTSEGEYIREYIPCDMSGVNYCYEYFSFCKKFINNKWEIQAISGPPLPQFECLDEDCSSYCF